MVDVNVNVNAITKSYRNGMNRMKAVTETLYKSIANVPSISEMQLTLDPYQMLSSIRQARTDFVNSIVEMEKASKGFGEKINQMTLNDSVSKSFREFIGQIDTLENKLNSIGQIQSMAKVAQQAQKVMEVFSETLQPIQVFQAKLSGMKEGSAFQKISDSSILIWLILFFSFLYG